MTKPLNLDSLGTFGVVRDVKPYLVDPAAWSDVLNVRCREGSIGSMEGRIPVFGTPSQAPYFIIGIKTPADTLWVWASLTKGWVWDGLTHTDITRASGGNYAASKASDWNATIIGGILILNNGVDVPQFWATPSTGTDLANLTNWPSTLRAKVIRTLGPFLVAIHISKSGTVYPHMVKWSHPTDPGAVPVTWDETDPAFDAGEQELPDTESGVLLDALSLRGQLFLYKGNATWRMRYVGGQDVFAFDPFLESSGILAARCVAQIGDGFRHFVVSQDDVLYHDGNAPTSIMDKRMRRYLFGQMDVTNYVNSFAFTNFENKECWFCYPVSGATNPNMAVVWNWQDNTITETEVDFVAAATGNVAVTDTETWNSDSNSWNSDTTLWANVNRRKVVVAKPSATKFLQLDSGVLFDGVAPIVRAQRLALALTGRKRDRTPIVDWNSRKFVTRVLPRLTGGPVNVRIGAQDSPEGEVRWSEPVAFSPENIYADLIAEGAGICIEFASHAAVSWELEGYTLDMDVIAEY